MPSLISIEDKKFTPRWIIASIIVNAIINTLIAVILAQEMDVVKNYLDVFSVRTGERLAYRIDIPDNLRNFMIPPLLIQPLVENVGFHSKSGVPL